MEGETKGESNIWEVHAVSRKTKEEKNRTCTTEVWWLACLTTYSVSFPMSGLLPREPPAGSGSEAHYPSATHTLRHPLQVQQGWVQDEGAGACALGLLCKNTLVSIPWVTCVLLSNRGKKWRRNIVAQRCWCLSLSGDYVELYNWAALLYWSHPTDPGARGNTGVLPWEVDLSPHSMYCSVLSIDYKTILKKKTFFCMPVSKG